MLVGTPRATNRRPPHRDPARIASSRLPFPPMDNPWASLGRTPPFVAPIDAGRVDDAFRRKYNLRCELLPLPFVGDPARAGVILLQLNPGYSELDEEDEAEIPEFADVLRSTLNLAAPEFMFLDRRFKRTSAAYWW